jgi:uncharacterized protein (TIGR03905 family)
MGNIKRFKRIYIEITSSCNLKCSFCQETKRPAHFMPIEFDVVDNKVTGVKFEGGCSGNTQGVAALVEGMDVNEAIKRMEGIKCGFTMLIFQ